MSLAKSFGIGLGWPQASGQRANTALKITPTGTLNGDGLTWETAGSLLSLPAYVTRAAAEDREIWIRSDAGSYTINNTFPPRSDLTPPSTASIVITTGGTQAKPVKIRGAAASGAPDTAVITGTRRTDIHVFGADNDQRGYSPFEFRGSADHINISGLQINRQNRVFVFAGNRVGLHFQNISGDYFRSFFTNLESSGAIMGSITDWSITDAVFNYIDNCIVQFAQSVNGVVRNLTGDGHHMVSTTETPVGVQFMGNLVGSQLASHDNLVENCAMANLRSRGQSSYWNGDGFVDERGSFNHVWRSCTSSGMTDGGFDLKSEGVLVEDCTASGNKKNFRLWGSGIVRDCTSIAPVKPSGAGGSGPTSHVSFPNASGGETRFTIENLTVQAPGGNVSPIFVVDTGYPVYVTMDDGNVTALGCVDAPDAPLQFLTAGLTPASMPINFTWA